MVGPGLNWNLQDEQGWLYWWPWSELELEDSVSVLEEDVGGWMF